MQLNELYVPIILLNDYQVDKDTALPLSEGTLYLYRDTARIEPKAAYELVNNGGNYVYQELPNPIVLSSVGTALNDTGKQVAVYLKPYIEDPITGILTVDRYYIVCKDKNGNEQWTREAVPNLTDANNPINDGANDIDNQISNPQFTRYFLEDKATDLLVNGVETTFNIAPNWSITGTGSGNITVERIAVAGNETIPTSPAYYLRVTTNIGVTSATLRQRFKFNSGLWSGKFISGFIAARLEQGSNALTMKYKDSSGVNSNVTVFAAGLVTQWESFGGSVQLKDSSNSQSGENAYVDIAIELPVGSVVDITSIQILVSDSDFLDVVGYSERTANREQALMGDYYIPNLEYKKTPSLLIGWDFPLNPRQFKISGSVSGGTAEYIWDQTILQTYVGLTVNFGENIKTNGLSLNHQQPNLPYALIQYLDKNEATKFIGTPLSVNVNGYTVAGSNAPSPTTIKIKMFANKDDNKFPILPDTIIDLSLNGDINLTPSAMNDGWYEIPRSNLPVATNKLQTVTDASYISTIKDIKFNQWLITDGVTINNGTKGIAIVVSFLPTPETTNYETQIDSISVTPGNVPTRPSFLDSVLTLKQCQRYFETTYQKGSDIGLPLIQNYRTRELPIGPLQSGIIDRHTYAGGIEIYFDTAKRAIPKIEFYAVSTGTIKEIDVDINQSSGAGGNSGTIVFLDHFVPDLSGGGVRAITYHGLTSTPLITGASIPDAGVQGSCAFHNTIDARIGIV